MSISQFWDCFSQEMLQNVLLLGTLPQSLGKLVFLHHGSQHPPASFFKILCCKLSLRQVSMSGSLAVGESTLPPLKGQLPGVASTRTPKYMHIPLLQLFTNVGLSCTQTWMPGEQVQIHQIHAKCPCLHFCPV